MIVVDENGDIEGNLVMAASLTSPTTIAFMVKHGSGIVSVGMKAEDLERLELPLMSPEKEDDSSAPSFTITVVCIVSGSICAPHSEHFLASHEICLHLVVCISN